MVRFNPTASGRVNVHIKTEQAAAVPLVVPFDRPTQALFY